MGTISVLAKVGDFIGLALKSVREHGLTPTDAIEAAWKQVELSTTDRDELAKKGAVAVLNEELHALRGMHGRETRRSGEFSASTVRGVRFSSGLSDVYYVVGRETKNLLACTADDLRWIWREAEGRAEGFRKTAVWCQRALALVLDRQVSTVGDLPADVLEQLTKEWSR